MRQPPDLVPATLSHPPQGCRFDGRLFTQPCEHLEFGGDQRQLTRGPSVALIGSYFQVVEPLIEPLWPVDDHDDATSMASEPYGKQAIT